MEQVLHGETIGMSKRFVADFGRDATGFIIDTAENNQRVSELRVNADDGKIDRVQTMIVVETMCNLLNTYCTAPAPFGTRPRAEPPAPSWPFRPVARRSRRSAS